MSGILEVSIYGSIFFFANNFTEAQLNQLSSFTKKYFQNKCTPDIDNMLNEYMLEVEKNLKIELVLMCVTKVIAV